jgi:hypothetical protein
MIFVTLNGCLYFGESGVSTKLYNDCKEYYDNDGNYIKECPENLIEYSDFEDESK